MEGYDASTYGERFAAAYDDWTVSVGIAATTAAAVAAIVELLDDLGRAGGPVLELGIGTGRVALPLAARGVEVHGIDASAAMVEQLRAKPGGESIPVAMGDFAGVPVEGSFPLVYVVFNTFFALLSQDDQVRCFAGVARHLTPDGVFVLTAFVPDLSLYSGGQSVQAHGLG
ncbi:MAG TPA: class I SAM-dependent methyltransferase, partial [Nitriliruptorales bacterium]|nr:class I SAM-dependent methyltransferase [Nitriliruptorales bacterium]